jgi:hypothetical protein
MDFSYTKKKRAENRHFDSTHTMTNKTSLDYFTHYAHHFLCVCVWEGGGEKCFSSSHFYIFAESSSAMRDDDEEQEGKNKNSFLLLCLFFRCLAFRPPFVQMRTHQPAAMP